MCYENVNNNRFTIEKSILIQTFPNVFPHKMKT